MNEKMISNWNSVVGKDDCVFVLGDFALAKRRDIESVAKRLNGRKFLVMGNHDRTRSSAFWQEVGFDWVSMYPIIIADSVILSHEPPPILSDLYSYIYGHVHNDESYADYAEHGHGGRFSACVSVERIGYTPVLLEDVVRGKVFANGIQTDDNQRNKTKSEEP